MKYIIFTLVFVCGSLIGWALCRGGSCNEEEIEANGISTPPMEEGQRTEQESRVISYLMWVVCSIGWAVVIGYLVGSMK